MKREASSRSIFCTPERGQQTAESPQLFWSHQLAVGNAYDLARKPERPRLHLLTILQRNSENPPQRIACGDFMFAVLFGSEM